MARLMLTHVSQNGTITYEHYCDTLSDRSEILDKYITLGSYCFVLHGTNGVDIYVADSNKTWCLTPTARPNLQIKNVSTNGTVIADRGYDGLEQVIVRVPTNSEEGLVLANKIITENGIYNPVDENLDGYDKVTVNVQKDTSMMNYLILSDRYTNSCKILNNWAGPFNTTYTYFRPSTINGDILKPDWTQPFEIFVEFKVTQTVNHSMVLFGAEQDFFYCPTIEVSGNNNGLFCGLSTNGSSWDNQIYFDSTNDIKVLLNTIMTIKVIYDGENYTATFNNGETSLTKTIKINNTPYYSNLYNLEFGGIAKSANHIAEYIFINLDNTYIKQNNSLIWGYEKDNNENNILINDYKDELLYNSNFLLNTTGQTYWNTNNSGTNSNNRVNIIDGWSAMECIVEQVENGLKIIPKKNNAYLLCQIPQYWFKEKNMTASATINGELFTLTALFASAFTNTSVGTLYLYSYSDFDNAFTLSFIDKIDQEIIINNTSLKLAT